MYHIVSRSPREIASYTKTLNPFSPIVWGTVAGTLLCLHLMIYIAHSVYATKEIAHMKLQKGDRSLVSFGISVYFKVTEPEAIDMFTNKWSTGRLLSFIWAVLCFFVIAFYNSNLRAHLAAITYELPTETIQEIIVNQRKVWIMKEMGGNLYVNGTVALCFIIPKSILILKMLPGARYWRKEMNWICPCTN